MGLNLVIPFEIPFSPIFSLQPELHFTQKGGRFEDMVKGQENILAVKTYYLELPVLLIANYGTKKVKCYVFVAPCMSYATNRFTVKKMGNTERIKEDIDFIVGENAKSQRWELSALAGIGGAIKAGIGSIVSDVRYSVGLTDNTNFKNNKPDDWAKTTNTRCTLSIGYMIPIGIL